MSEIHYGPPRNDAEVSCLRNLLFRSFVASDDIRSVDPWLERAGAENVRCLTENGDLVGGLFRIPMGQYVGERPIRTAGVAAVAIDPARRGERLGHELMRRALIDFHDEGYPLSTLFASTFGLYRSVGYERSGGHYQARVRLRDIGLAERELAVRPWRETDRPAAEALADGWARRHTGHLQRGPYVRDRIEHPQGVPAVHSWVVLERGEIVGLARWHQPRARGDQSAYDLEVLDFAAANGRAVRRILTLCADHSSLGGELVWSSGPTDPFLLALPERYFRLELQDLWMLRIVDVPAALEARGWPIGVSGELHLSISDPILPDNSGTFVLELEGGRARVQRGGSGRIRLDVRALAPLFTGFLTPDALALQGWIQGPAEDLERAGTFFVGPAPWLPDLF